MKKNSLLIALLCLTVIAGSAKGKKTDIAERYQRARIAMPMIFTGYFNEEGYGEIFRAGELEFKPGVVEGIPTVSLDVHEVFPVDSLAEKVLMIDSIQSVEFREIPLTSQLEVMTPQWLANEQFNDYFVGKTRSRMMLENPSIIKGSYETLYKAPKIAEVPRQTIEQAIEQIEVPLEEAQPEIVEIAPKRQYWLHELKTAIQFSQAYISPNWYQGGNNHLSLVGDFYWNVKLNEVYHKDLMLQSTVSYKLVLNSSPQDEYHPYNIAEDIFQWNFKFGVRAYEKWFYSFTAQAKTQFFNNYDLNSPVRKASFLSPGDFNVGLGMTYATANKKKTFKLNISLAPLSYNVKSCIDSHVDPVQFGLKEGQKWRHEIGSNGELTIEWALRSNINYKSRLFLFSDYKYFLGDWENTLSFSINKFLSTQLYWRMRYDTSRPTYKDWGHWMLKEILSFGFSYTFK